MEITKICPGAVFAVVKISTTAKQLEQSTLCNLLLRSIRDRVQIELCFLGIKFIRLTTKTNLSSRLPIFLGGIKYLEDWNSRTRNALPVFRYLNIDSKLVFLCQLKKVLLRMSKMIKKRKLDELERLNEGCRVVHWSVNGVKTDKPFSVFNLSKTLFAVSIAWGLVVNPAF